MVPSALIWVCPLTLLVHCALCRRPLPPVTDSRQIASMRWHFSLLGPDNVKYALCTIGYPTLFLCIWLLTIVSFASTGTTYSCVAIYEGNNVEIIANEQGSFTTPSFVSFTDKERLIGEAAKNNAAMNPKNTVFDAK